MNKKIYNRNTMSDVNMRMYNHVMGLHDKALKNGDSENALRLKQEALGYIETSNHHDLIGQVCGEEFVYG